MTIEYKDSKRIIALLIRQGYDGAGGVTNIAGGGGGAGVAANGMNGGNGSQNDITGTNLYYAGGGGGAADGYSTGGTGGQGGGGRGGDNNTGSIGGTDGLGGGAGGGGNTTNDGTGGSGVVILRFTTSGNGYSQAGGTVDTSVSGQTIISWTATSGTRTFTPTSSFNVRYLVVAGGGGSMENWGHAGGAGAGGMLEGTGKEVTAQAYTIVVGAGGANGGGSGMPSQGGNSVFSDITATGGGYGGNWYSGSTNAGGNGGSGGGGQSGSSNYAGGSGTVESKPTDVQDNSILIEKDTAKRYWRTGASGLTEEQQLSNAEQQDLNSGAKGMGEYVRSTSSKLYGKILTDIQFYLKKASPQAGAKVYARHYSSANVLIHTYWEKLASDLPTSLTWTTETTLSGDTAFANGDYFVVEYTETDGTTATGAVQTNRKDSTNANQWDGSNSGFINTYFGSSSYLDTGNMDIWFKGTTATAPTWTYELPKSSSLKLHLDASDASTITKVSNLVSQWNDKSGNNNNVVQATATNKPTWTDSQLNGLPAIVFNGSDNSMNKVTWAEGEISQPYYVFAVMTLGTNTASSYRWDGGTSGSDRFYFYQGSNNNALGKASAGTEMNVTDTMDGNFRYITFLVSGSNSNYRKDGTSHTSGDMGTNGWNGITFASRYSNEAYNNPKICEFLVYDSDIGTATRDKVESYLKDKWGL